MKTMQPGRELPGGHAAPIWTVAFSPDGKKALSAGGYPKRSSGGMVEYEDCGVRVWELPLDRYEPWADAPRSAAWRTARTLWSVPSKN